MGKGWTEHGFVTGLVSWQLGCPPLLTEGSHFVWTPFPLLPGLLPLSFDRGVASFCGCHVLPIHTFTSPACGPSATWRGPGGGEASQVLRVPGISARGPALQKGPEACVRGGAELSGRLRTPEGPSGLLSGQCAPTGPWSAPWEHGFQLERPNRLTAVSV